MTMTMMMMMSTMMRLFVSLEGVVIVSTLNYGQALSFSVKIIIFLAWKAVRNKFTISKTLAVSLLLFTR